MAAEGGNPSAQFFIGLHYLSSDKPEMVDVGINWLVQAARNGETSARQFLLKAKRRNWFPVPDNFEISTTVTQVTADNIKQVFPESAKAQAPQQSLQSSLQQAQAQFEQATPPAVHPSTVQ
jgi:TPR repeat protein